MRSIVVAFLLTVIALPLSTHGNKMELIPSHGTFKKMLVFINDNVPEHEGRLLESLKESLKAASRALWTATENLDTAAAPNAHPVQFGNIFIRLPSTWTVPGQPLTWQQCTKADLFLTTAADNGNRWLPKTKQLGKCGQSAESMQLPESFFLNIGHNISLRQKGKIFMTEFAKLRYGVFSEKPYRGVLSVFDGFNFVNSTCGSDIRWKMNLPVGVCSEPNDECKYSIEADQNHSYSVMFDSETPSSEYFCNDHTRPHNKKAKTLHNLKCGKRSVASVILSHSDFSSTVRPKLPYREPTFTIVKGQTRRLVLVLDVSSSMAPIITTMKQAAAEFVTNIDESAYVGLVSFSSNGIILNYLTPMNSQSNRNSILAQIRGLASGGWTNIPDGLEKGVQVLGGTIRNSESVLGTIILLSDGGNNKQNGDYDTFIEAVIKKGIVANTISYGTKADPKLTRLAQGSSGKFLFAAANDYTQLVKVFEDRAACGLTINQTSKVLEDERILMLGSGVLETELAQIDSFVGTNVKIDITFPQVASGYLIQLLNPNGTIFNSQKKTPHTNGFTLTFQLSDQHIPGMYKLRIQRSRIARVKRQAQQMRYYFVVTATNSDRQKRKIIPTGKLLTTEIKRMSSHTEVPVYVDLTSCGLEAGENVTVTLTMTDPARLRSTFPMTDDGLGSDSISGDQIYSTSVYAKDLKSAGFFTFSASVMISIIDGETIYRSVNLGSLRILTVQSEPIEDKILPSTIDSVEIKVVDVKKRNLELKFRASGNDGMQGEISKYIVKVKWPGDPVAEAELPKVITKIVSPGDIIKMNVDLFKFNVTNPFHIQVRGLDDNGNMGVWSQSTTFNWHFEEIKKKSIAEEQKQGRGASEGCFLSPLLIFAFQCLVFVFL